MGGSPAPAPEEAPPARSASCPRQDLDKLALAVALHPCDAEDLSLMELEGYASKRRYSTIGDGCQVFDSKRDWSRRRRLLVHSKQDLPPDHVGSDLLLVRLFGDEVADHLPSPHHCDAVRDLKHLAQLVADEDDRPALFDQAPEDYEQLSRLLRRQHPGRFIEDEDLGAAVQDFDDLGSLLEAYRQVASPRIGVEGEAVTSRELGDLLPRLTMVIEAAGRHRFTAEHHVLPHREDRDEHEVLVHHPDPLRNRVARSADSGGPAIDQDFARVRVDQSIQDVHQGALAGAVLAHEGVDLAGAYREVDMIVGDHTRPGLGDGPHVDGESVRRLRVHSVPGE